jgi:transcriptional regulator GlxA family with amidase domain
MDDRSPHHATPPVLPRGVRRAIDAMRINLEREWSVADLATVGGLSSRTLQRQFRIFLGKAPSAALRDLRFEHARRELLQGGANTKVTDVALRCGFPHGGRFSIEYRRRYGETPSQTLKRQAVFLGALPGTTGRSWRSVRSRRRSRIASSRTASPTSSRWR